MGTEFLKIKESEDALEIIQNLFDKYYTLQRDVYKRQSFCTSLYKLFGKNNTISVYF